MERGLIQVYTGSGKGKTTAAIGLAVRALGQGMRVLLVRFLKPEEPKSGEVAFLEGCPEIDVVTSGMGILCGQPDRDAVSQSVVATFDLARAKIAEGRYDLAIFDEINNALRRGYLPIGGILAFLENKPESLEIVFTGRGAPQELLERADLVTTMEETKHPLKKGIPARRGIEY